MIEKKIDIKWALVSILGLVILWVGYMATPVHSAITGIVTGKTIDNIGDPIAGVRVSLISIEGRNPNKEAISNKKGVFRFVSISPGEYIISAELEGYSHRGGSNFRVSANSSINFDVFMDPVPETDSVEFEGSDT